MTDITDRLAEIEADILDEGVEIGDTALTLLAVVKGVLALVDAPDARMGDNLAHAPLGGFLRTEQLRAAIREGLGR